LSSASHDLTQRYGSYFVVVRCFFNHNYSHQARIHRDIRMRDNLENGNAALRKSS
jgi:hypothetical protein